MDVLVVRSSGRESEEILKWVRNYYAQQAQKGLPGVSLSVKEKPKAKRPYLKTRDGTVIETAERIKKYISDFVPRLMAMQPPPPPPRREAFEEDDEEEFFDFGDPLVPIKDDVEDEEDVEVKRREEEFRARHKPAGESTSKGAPKSAPKSTKGASKSAPQEDEPGSDEEEDFADASLYEYWDEQVANKGE